MMSLTRLLVVAAIAYGIYWYSTRPDCGTSGALACPDPALEEGVGVTLAATEVCKGTGYLCVGRPEFQVARWALDKGRLHVRVPTPEFLEGDTALQIRDAAIEGIMEWNDHPFPLVIETGEFDFSWDIGVVWSKGLQNAEAGVARLSGRPNGKRFELSADGLAVWVPPIATGEMPALGTDTDPSTFMERFDREMRGTQMGPALLDQVKATAMHEMGHMLGLTHSDSKNDIMFPQYRPDETEVRASKRDLLTVEALYALPNGAMVE